MTPTIDVGFVAQLRAGRIWVVAAVDHLNRHGVIHADGTLTRPDAILAATGYMPALQPVLGHLGVLDDRGRPLAQPGRTHPRAPRLWFVGMSNPLKGLLLHPNLDARTTARAIARRSSGLRALGQRRRAARG